MDHPWRGVVRLLIATIQRREEVAGLDWAELEKPKGPAPTWVLPPARAKNDKGHRVPLNRLAVAEIDRLQTQRRGLMFTTTGKTSVSGFSDAKERLDDYVLDVMQSRAVARGEDPEDVNFPAWRFHDLRRTGTTTLQRLGVIIEHTEAVINHISGQTSGVAGVYNLYKYENEKRRALELWGGHLEKLFSGANEASNVVAMKRA
jgi:integrase